MPNIIAGLVLIVASAIYGLGAVSIWEDRHNGYSPWVALLLWVGSSASAVFGLTMLWPPFGVWLFGLLP